MFLTEKHKLFPSYVFTHTKKIIFCFQEQAKLNQQERAQELIEILHLCSTLEAHFHTKAILAATGFSLARTAGW